MGAEHAEKGLEPSSRTLLKDRPLFAELSILGCEAAPSVADDLAQADLARRPGETGSAAAAAHSFDETRPSKIIDDLHQMIARDAVQRIDRANRGQSLRAGGEAHQHLHCVVSV